MPRKPRALPEEGFVHITVRGTNHCPIVVDDHDRWRWFGYLAAALADTRAALVGVCLMTTHAHLVFELEGADISRTLQLLMGPHCLVFNLRHGRDGHLVGGRFRHAPIANESHLLEAIRYVELNPVRVGLCAHPGDWRWSSYRAIAFGDTTFPFIRVERVLDLLGGEPGTARSRYRIFVESGLADGSARAVANPDGAGGQTPGHVSARHLPGLRRLSAGHVHSGRGGRASARRASS